MKIFLAGLDNAPEKAIILNIHPYSLFTYHYFKNCSEKNQTFFVSEANKLKSEVICDSGLFTFMFGTDEGKSKHNDQFWEDYTAKYIETAKSWGFKGNLTLVESDVHKVSTVQCLKKLRRKYFERCDLPVQYVWHIEEGLNALKDLAHAYDFIGISVLELKRLFKGQRSGKWKDATRDLIRRLLDHAGKGKGKTLKIHLLGNTIEDLLNDTDVYSSDSTSWLAGVRYGTAICFNRNKMKRVSLSSKAYKELHNICYKKNPHLFAKLEDTQGRDIPGYKRNYLVCSSQYALLQKYLDEKFPWKYSKSEIG